MPRRINLELSDQAYANLERLRQSMNKPSRAEVIRSAVGLLDHAMAAQRRGEEVVIAKDGKIERRLIIV